jgi:hypothetical protein
LKCDLAMLLKLSSTFGVQVVLSLLSAETVGVHHCAQPLVCY